jgi:hypothetical protein
MKQLTPSNPSIAVVTNTTSGATGWDGPTILYDDYFLENLALGFSTLNVFYR